MNVAIIPAKGFSSRIPNKNRRLFHGEPIIAYSIRAALESGLFGSVVVSTDSDEIVEIAHEYGADVMKRGPAWALDAIGPLDVARHSLSLIGEVSLVCVLYATAPMMRVGDIIAGYRAVQRPGVSFACSVGTVPFLHDAAQFFWARAWALRERVPEFGDNTVLIPVDPLRDCDINVEADWERAEEMYAALNASSETSRHATA